MALSPLKMIPDGPEPRGSTWLTACVIGLAIAASIRGAAQAPPADSGADDADIAKTDPQTAAIREAQLITGIRQLTFEGRRAGEGYFSRDGSRMVFQSEREPANPFFQIYLMDLETGDIERISPGHGKTTCAWIHPDGERILFASTHDDPSAKDKQEEEIRLRESGRQRRYSWDYDPHYDIYCWDRSGDGYRNLTHAQGYDAEGSWSPDGKRIVFSSNRQAYTRPLGDDEAKQFETDPSYLIDIYIMNEDGTGVRQLTTEPGYDGGPFFSPDGKRICWRHFSENGATAEIMTMNIDGSDKRPLTHLGVMSWAPFYHPSGEYLIFTTNRHGFANFELYLVDVEGHAEPQRATYSDGFDGLPVFSPDGRRLAWTSNRTASRQSQIFLAEWNHEKARQLLGLDETASDDGVPQTGQASIAEARDAALHARNRAKPDFSPADILRHVDYLCRDELAGRMTGTPGEKMATAYVAAYFDSLGLMPAGDDGTWFQGFEFTSGIAFGPANSLAVAGQQYQLDRDWRPVSFSATGKFESAPVVFAGYGTFAPESEEQPQYDSYVHLDVQDKWVMAFRFLPEGIAPERRQHLFQHASLRYKAMVARDKGARGLIIVSGPNSKVKSQLVPLRFDGSISGASIPVISVTDQLAQQWLSRGSKSLADLQDQLDTGEPSLGFEIAGVNLSASIDIEKVKRRGRNVLGRLQIGEQPTDEMIVIGAHIDHLGTGLGGTSLAREDEKGAIHYGADDNASGVAAMLEIAEYLSSQRSQGRFDARRDVLFAGWSGEEIGLIGSSHFAKTFALNRSGSDAPHGSPSHPPSLYPSIAAYLNLDMVGRLEKRLILQGVGSSSVWRGEIERRNVPVGLPIVLQEDSYLPTDANTFYLQGVPILAAFTGSHSDYHTPRDTPEKLNYDDAARIARLMSLIARSMATREDAPDYVAQSRPQTDQRRAHLRAYLGTIPDYAESDTTGVRLSGVAKDGPAAKAGIGGGDIIVELAGKKIENIYDYTFAIEAMQIGKTVPIVVLRNGQRVPLEITPGSRD